MGETVQRRPHVSETPLTFKTLHRHLDWLNCILIVGLPLVGFSQIPNVALQWQTAVWAGAYYFATALGITAGYHRLWSHTSYQATLPLEIFLAAVGGGAVQGSIRWWSRHHRAHHRYTDTDKDPYSVHKGLLYAHFGWMVFKQDSRRFGRTDISDLNSNPVVRFQHKHYLFIVIFMGIIVPGLVSGIGWNDWVGGFLYAGVLRMFAVQQATFCVNSLAHYLGDQPFDDRHSPRDHFFTALMTLGEGYHNFHHEFPSDYRNALDWWQYDPTKWFIWGCKQVGLAYDLKEFRANIIEAGRLQQMQKTLDMRRNTIDWGKPISTLPVYSWDDFMDMTEDGRALVAIAGVIHDVTDFVQDHPGGRALISSAIGKDATAMFNGAVYSHSNAAHNLLATMRYGILQGGMEVEAWKRSAKTSQKLAGSEQPSGTTPQ